MEYKHVEVVVLGAGPGGYAAAFYASSMGKKVLLVDKRAELGGVCLNEGCIPSKALIHAAEIIHQAKEAKEFGITFGKHTIDIKKCREWKNGIIKKLNQGIAGLCDKKNVEFLRGRGYFEDGNTLRVETEKGQQFIKFENAIIATGSEATIPSAFDLGNKRIMTSKEALELDEIPKNMLVVGGGYIGMELGSVYASLGSKVTVIEAMDSILAGADKDLVRPVFKKATDLFEEIYLKAKVSKMATKGKQIEVSYTHNDKEKVEYFDKVLVSVGRTPNSENLGINNTSISLDDRGFINVNHEQKTNESSIYAIGDITGGAMLAHKASAEAKIAVESIMGQRVTNKELIIPAVVFTDPEVAWCGLTEAKAKADNISVEVSKFSWAASGRALSLNRTDGLTKLILEPNTHRILGVGIVGPGAGELIGEGILAVTMGATAEDLTQTVHAHPTLSETLLEAAEVFFGHSAHAFNPKLEGKSK